MRLLRSLSALEIPRRSLLVQLLGVYLLFVALVLGIDFQVNAVAQQQVTSQVQTTDMALAQEIALDTDSQVHGAELALVQLSRLPAVRSGDTGAMMSAFGAFRAARRDIDLVYWLDSHGTLQASFPSNFRTLGSNIRALGTDFGSRQAFAQAFEQARAEPGAPHPVLEDGIVDLTTFEPVAALAMPVRDGAGRLIGILAANLGLNDLNQSFQPIIDSQRQHRQHLDISIVDAQGRLIGTAERERLLQPVLGELPGVRPALAGSTATRQGSDARGQAWLYSAVPVRSLAWAVVVQHSRADALAVLDNFRRWIAVAAGLFALGGLMFWLVLLVRVVRPLHALARRHSRLPAGGSPVIEPLALAGREDEMGELARSLCRLERDVVTQLAELHTLLETSSAVVTSLDPIAVGRTIIDEVQRLVDIQAAAVFVPDEEEDVLRVLVSEGRDERHDQAATVRLDDPSKPAALALREGRPVQMVAGEDEPYPALSQAAGFRTLLAIPIISRHVGGVALVVHRTEARRFSDHEIELLLTFANYATLAWEHAVLYERSDERLREIARENERLYREATAEKQTLAATMSSMSDGLILTGVHGRVLYTNPGASAIIGLPREALASSHIDRIHEALRGLARDAAAYDRMLARVHPGEALSWVLESEAGGRFRAVAIRFFDVRDESTEVIGFGLLLRDVTREQELDQFKTTLLGAVGHELRTPLAAIKGYASTLLQDDVAWSPGEQRHFLHTISAEADRLAQLVTNILDLSRSDAGLLPLHRVSCRVDDLVASAVRRLQTPIPEFVVGLPPTLPPVEVDRARVEVVLHNLLANALAYGDGRVEIGAERRDGTVVLHVADNGPGIDEAELVHIFERFYRADHGSRRRLSGTGLGLAISKAFVEAHGGAVWAESTGRGTIISFSLPVSTANGDGRLPAPRRVGQPAGHGPPGGAS